DTDTAAAIVAFAAPSAAISKALARTTSRCAADCDRANDSNTSRCPSVIANAGTGLLILKSYQFTTNYLGDTPLVLVGFFAEERLGDHLPFGRGAPRRHRWGTHRRQTVGRCIGHRRRRRDALRWA